MQLWTVVDVHAVKKFVFALSISDLTVPASYVMYATVDASFFYSFLFHIFIIIIMLLLQVLVIAVLQLQRF